MDFIKDVWNVKISGKEQKKSKWFFANVLWFLFFLEIFSTLLTLLCFNCLFHMNNHIDKIVHVMFVEIVSWWNVISENIRKKAPHFFWFQVGNLNITKIFYKIQNFKWLLVFAVITHWTYTCLSPWALTENRFTQKVSGKTFCDLQRI